MWKNQLGIWQTARKDLGSFLGLCCAWRLPPPATFCLVPFSGPDWRVLQFLLLPYYRLGEPLQESIQQQWHTHFQQPKKKRKCRHLIQINCFSGRRPAAIPAGTRSSFPKTHSRCRDAWAGTWQPWITGIDEGSEGTSVLIAHKPIQVWKRYGHISRHCCAHPVTVFLDRSNMLKWHFSSLQLFTGSYLQLTDPYFMPYNGNTTWFLPWQNHLVPFSSPHLS